MTRYRDTGRYRNIGLRREVRQRSASALRCALLGALLCVPFAGGALPVADARPDQARSTEASSAERQILVTVRLPPRHFRPESDYGGGYDSRLGREPARRVAAAIADAHDLQLIAEWPITALGVDCFVMQARGEQSAADLARRLADDPRVESAQAMHAFHVLGYNDPLYPLQPSAALWHLAELHASATGRDVVIAEVDSGVDLDHPDLRGQVSLAKNFVDGDAYKAEVHGTAVAGIIAANADDGIGIAGVAPRAKLLALRACWQTANSDGAALCNSFTLAKALQFALEHDVQIINMSLSGPPDALLRRLLQIALVRGITVVAAADPVVNDGGFPAAFAGVLAVAAERSGAPRDALLAPGRDIPTSVPGGWNFVAGSSFAAAHVTGMVALLRELNPHLLPAQVHAALVPATAVSLAGDGPVTVDACAVMARAAGTCACACNTTREALSSPYHLRTSEKYRSPPDRVRGRL